MSRVVHLNGGPWHGQAVSIEDGRDHIHIVGMVEDRSPIEAEHKPDDHIKTREGIYSQVAGHGNETEFEWDGWGSSHD